MNGRSSYLNWFLASSVEQQYETATWLKDAMRQPVDAEPRRPAAQRKAERVEDFGQRPGFDDEAPFDGRQALHTTGSPLQPIAEYLLGNPPSCHPPVSSTGCHSLHVGQFGYLKAAVVVAGRVNFRDKLLKLRNRGDAKERPNALKICC
jgi:hypothetical protein